MIDNSNPPAFNLKAIEKAAVIGAITYAKGNVQYARELLDVSKATIYRLLREYSIDYNAIREYNEFFTKPGFKRRGAKYGRSHI